MERPTKRSRENKRLLDSLGGGRETTTPRQARTARKLINHSNSSSSINNNNNLNNNLNNLNNINNNLNNINNNLNNHIKQINIKQINIKQINNKHSDSSLSELSDSLEQQQPSPSKTFTTNQLQKQTPSSSLPSTPTSNHSSMKQQPILKNHPSLRRKTIIKRSHSSFARHHHHIKSNYHRSHRNSRKLTEDQKREIEKTRIKLLKNLEKEEDLIKSSQHPILISLEKNVRIGKEIKLNQAREKLNRLINYLNLLNLERQQRIWETWIDTKMRLRNEMIVDCQIRLNRAPFEFLISNDTTNLRAIFHLTSTPAAVYNRPKLSISQVKKTIAEAAGAAGVDTTGQTRHAGSATQGRVVNSSWAGSGMMEESCTKSKEEEIRNGSSKSKRLIKSRKTQSNRRVVNHDHHDIDPNILELVDEGLQFDEEQEVEKNKIPFLESVDLIDGLIHQKIRCHNVWKLSNHAVDHDLNLIKTSTRF